MHETCSHGDRLSADLELCIVCNNFARIPPANRELTSLHAPAAQADEPLGQFMDYCTYGHMIDNVVLIVTGTLHERDVHVRAHRTCLAACPVTSAMAANRLETACKSSGQGVFSLHLALSRDASWRRRCSAHTSLTLALPLTGG